MNETLDNLIKLQELVAELRDKDRGCPWILMQDLQSLTALTIEESYELAESIASNDPEEIADELGDVLLHMVLYAQLGKEANQFNLDTIASKAIEKQLRRKPIFHDHAAKNAAEALAQWEENKRIEKQHNSHNNSVLDGIATSLPALNRAVKLQAQAGTVGFDWQDVNKVFDKIQEELQELQHELDHKASSEKIRDELGDVLFACVNLARHLVINPEEALRHANQKFYQRFRLLEKIAADKQQNLKDLTLEQMDLLWEQAKKELHK